MRTFSKNLYSYRKLLFPEQYALRILIHVLFWILFICYHLLFFLPAFVGHLRNQQIIWAYVVYYARYIPLYYLIMMIYPLARKQLSPLLILPFIFTLLLLAMHFITIAMYHYYEAAIGLKNLPSNFAAIGRLYMAPLFEQNGVLIYDLLDLQLLVLPVALKMIKYSIRRDMDEIRWQSEKVQSELNSLRLQLTPHFILNILNSTSAELKSVSKKGINYLSQAADLIRFALYDAEKEFIPLKRELHYIHQYIELESMRTRQRSEIALITKGDVLEDQYIPTLVLISLVENAFKHSVHATSEQSYIRIHSEIDDSQLHFQVVNSIPLSSTLSKGFSEPKQRGIGLTNIRRILELKFPSHHQLDIQQDELSFSVKLRIQLSYKSPQGFLPIVPSP